uniref:SEA domain-containing protein n=1 Tax=Syphacia muris TaxID=451379 RepID=A0A0N5AJU1_9BILA
MLILLNIETFSKINTFILNLTTLRDSFESNSTERVAYEVGSGAEFMERAGWSSRSPYGKNAQERNDSQISFYKYRSDDDLSYNPNNSSVAVVTFSSTMPQLPVWTQPQPYPTTSRITTLQPTRQTQPPTSTSTRLQQFMCQLYIREQANPSYNNTSSYEYQQASQLAYNAIRQMLLSTSLNRNFQSLNILSLANSGNDLIISAALAFQSTADNSVTVGMLRSIFQSNTAMLENLLNHVQIDIDRLYIQSEYSRTSR